MAQPLSRLLSLRSEERRRDGAPFQMERFREDPEAAYAELLEAYSPMILRMIHRFMRDPDEVMEVYTSICERLQANDFQALRRFRPDSELAPWLSVVVANACRDRFRKQRATSVPRSVLKRLDETEQLVFKYFYWERLPQEDIAHLVSTKHGAPCTLSDVVRILAKIDDLLSVNKRWLLLVALSANAPMHSLDELSESGFQPATSEPSPDFDEALREREQLDALKAALDALDSEDRLLVLLRFEHGMTAPEIAEILRYESHKYVYTRLRTVVNKLRRNLGGE